jgi:hypothetical protein
VRRWACFAALGLLCGAGPALRRWTCFAALGLLCGSEPKLALNVRRVVGRTTTARLPDYPAGTRVRNVDNAPLNS